MSEVRELALGLVLAQEKGQGLLDLRDLQDQLLAQGQPWIPYAQPREE